MTQLLLGVVALAGVLWLLNGIRRASPTRAARWTRKAGGYAAMAVAALLLARGRVEMALPLFLLGAGLAGWTVPLPAPFGTLFGAGGGARRLRSTYLDVAIDTGGSLAGVVLAGRLVGRKIETLTPPETVALYREAAGDALTRSILEFHLDRRAPGWREHFQEDAAARPRERARNAMTQEEAHQILGVEPGATGEEIRRAHRALMKKLHPDQGGSTYLAARVNEARDLLLGGHR